MEAQMKSPEKESIKIPPFLMNFVSGFLKTDCNSKVIRILGVCNIGLKLLE